MDKDFSIVYCYVGFFFHAASQTDEVICSVCFIGQGVWGHISLLSCLQKVPGKHF